MDADVLDILKSKTAYICDRDRNGILSIIIPVPSELKPNDNVNLKITINYLMSSLRCESHIIHMLKYLSFSYQII